MRKIYSKINTDLLLHIVYRGKDIQSLETKNGLARTNVVPDEEFLQLAALQMNKGKTFKAHKHIFKNGEEKVIAQESWVVIKGKVKAILYDTDDTVIDEVILDEGDCSMTFRGGHNYEVQEDGTIVYEYKTVPYKGIEADKTFL